jgi:cation diffusion facilitator CzcD-associated flavoprotein CzcO
MATGCLSTKNTPKFPGLEDFRENGITLGTGLMRESEFAGKRVG